MATTFFTLFLALGALAFVFDAALVTFFAFATFFAFLGAFLATFAFLVDLAMILPRLSFWEKMRKNNRSVPKQKMYWY
ncbi:MAG TPA: hypothetical protein DIS90_09780 [Cytophagales bacterium]|nr:hypothetical protein [Cytophagales bacterium]HCR54501.1 hypothetical protein [Cytophagales bacterium]